MIDATLKLFVIDFESVDKEEAKGEEVPVDEEPGLLLTITAEENEDIVQVLIEREHHDERVEKVVAVRLVSEKLEQLIRLLKMARSVRHGCQ